jgi:ABC-type antimicrobial peptide transport system permease subunit
MNWKTYFTLEEKRKKALKRFFFIFLLLNLFFIRDFVFDPYSVCDDVNLTCYLEENESFNFTLNTSVDINKSVNVSSNATLQQDNLTSNQTNASLEEFVPTIDYFDYVWFDCGCALSQEQEFSLWNYRLFYTPLLLITNFLLAFILTYIFHYFSVRKIKKAETEEDGGEEDKDKKEEKK